jgi:hypothetical protein
VGKSDRLNVEQVQRETTLAQRSNTPLDSRYCQREDRIQAEDRGHHGSPSGALTSRTRGKQELGHEVEIVEGEIGTVRVVNPAHRLAAAASQPEIDVECDVCGPRCAAAAGLSKRSGEGQ